MRSIICLCIIYSEIALALFFAVGIARSYGLGDPPSCRPSRSYLTMPPCMTPSVTPQISTITSSRNISPTSTVREGWATWYSTNSVRDDYRRLGKQMPTNGIFPMANGKPLDDNALTVALWITNSAGRPLKPDGRLVKITDVQTLRAVRVAWRDNGPAAAQRSQNVICDLTVRAMIELAGNDGIRAGRVRVKVEPL